MAADPKEILARFDDADFVRDFIARSNTAVTAEMNQSRVASEVLLAKTISQAMAEHAGALQAGARASEKHARSLTHATWALFAATVALVFIAAAQLWR